MRKLVVYLSGGMRGEDWQSRVIQKCGDLDFVNPRQHGLDSADRYTPADLLGVKRCDVLLAYMADDNPSGIGLALEVGYALALGKTVVLVDRSEGDREKYMAIVRQAAQVRFDHILLAIAWLQSVAAMSRCIG